MSPGKLLVDYDSGRLLRADDEVVVSERFLRSHPYAATADGGQTYSVGPLATRHALARARREPVKFLDAVEYAVCCNVDGMLTLRKKEDA